MSNNDKIILDQVLEQKRQELAPDLNDTSYFEVFTSEQVFKDYDMSYHELQSGIVGNGGDGGIDSIYVFVNGDLVQEDTDFASLKKNVTIELFIIQSKTSPKFSEDVLDKFVAVTEDLLDLSHPISSYTSTYNEGLLKTVEFFRNAYELLAARFPSISVNYFYVSKGVEVHPNVQRKVSRLQSAVKNLFTSSIFNFKFLGARELLELARKSPKTTYSLVLAENPVSSDGEVGFICLVGLSDYFKFVTDENGKQLKQIFEANVRDYQGSTQVNEQIQDSLESSIGEDFWWLNNGVTILASQATQSGKTLKIENPEVVNGLQTSTEIVNYFSKANSKSDSRKILVRVIVPEKPESRDHIIKATNSQTSIPLSSLRATHKIHRDIEEYFRSHGLYYDRRKNYYKNEGKPIDKIVSIPSLAQAVMSVFLQQPDDARARPSSLLKQDDDYNRLFNPEYPINLYLFCVLVTRKVDAFLRSEMTILPSKDRNNLRFYIAMYVVAITTGSIQPSADELSRKNSEHITNEELKSVTEVVVNLEFTP